jgi:hypothetical protein
MRTMKREQYDLRAATALPSATGGRPPTDSGNLAGPLAAATGSDLITEIGNPNLAPQPIPDASGFFKGGTLRFAAQPQSFLPQPLNRPLEQYTVNNADMVNVTTAALEAAAQLDPSVLDGFDSAAQAATWAIAVIQRNGEPGAAPRMVDMVHQSRAGRAVYQALRRIQEAQNVES